jgi:hypothetical protein
LELNIEARKEGGDLSTNLLVIIQHNQPFIGRVWVAEMGELQVELSSLSPLNSYAFEGSQVGLAALKNK